MDTQIFETQPNNLAHLLTGTKQFLAELPTAAGTFTAVFLHLALPTATATQQVFPQTQCVWQL